MWPNAGPHKVRSKSGHFEIFLSSGAFPKKKTSARKTKTENALRARVFEIYTSYLVEVHIMTQ